MAWTECQASRMPFNDYGNIVDELKAAVLERYEGTRYVLQTYHSTDINPGTAHDVDVFLGRAIKFNNISAVVSELFSAAYAFTERSNSTTTNVGNHSIYYYWCSSPNLSSGVPVGIMSNSVEWTGGVGPWYSRQAADVDWTIDDQSYHAYGFITKDSIKIIIDELIRRLNHAYYLAIQDTQNSVVTYTVYDFSNGMGSKNFVYGENAFLV